ncbi:MAG TPA: WD40 repeat domain-containing protein [Chthonomonadaceae bacterium]|nr:WD40 repeat domain-containing protein [Chthonomonadaceae bacterium]
MSPYTQRLVCLVLGIGLFYGTLRAAIPDTRSEVPFHSAPTRPQRDWDYDGSRILGHIGNDVCLWDAQTGRLLHRLVGHGESIISVQFSPDGKQALSSSWRIPSEIYVDPKDTSTRLWDLVSGTEVRRFDGQVAATFSPDGERILTFSARDASATQFDAAIWDTAAGRRLVSAKLGQYAKPDFEVLRFSATGKEFFDVNQGALVLYDAANGDELGRNDFAKPPALRLHLYAPLSVALMGMEESDVFDLKAGRTVRSFPIRYEDYSVTGFSPDGHRAVNAKEGQFRICNLETGAVILGTKGGPYPQHVVVSPDAKRFVVVWGGVNGIPQEVGLYDLNTGKEIARIKRVEAGLMLGFAPDSQTFLFGGSTFVVYSAKTGKALRRLNLSGSALTGNSVEFTGNISEFP